MHLQSKKHLQKSCKDRLALAKDAYLQEKQDGGYFKNPHTNGFTQNHIFVALIEKALLVSDDLNKSDPRDTLVFGFHLLRLKKILSELGIAKPVESIAVILEKTGTIEDIGGNWSAATIHNKISKAQQLINYSKNSGACHDPYFLGSSPKVTSMTFVKSISNGCAKCLDSWIDCLDINEVNSTIFNLAAIEVTKEYPDLKDIIDLYLEEIENMPLPVLLNRIPESLRGIFSHLI